MGAYHLNLSLASETGILVDSDVLIDVLRKVPAAAFVLQDAKQHAPLVISVISRMELIAGSINREGMLQVESLLRRFQLFDLSEEISRTADKLVTQYYLSHGLLIPDALIAATALIHNIPLLSKNQRDYRFISDLKLLEYPAAS